MEYNLYIVIDGKPCNKVISRGDINYYGIGYIKVIKISFDGLCDGALFNNGIGF